MKKQLLIGFIFLGSLYISYTLGYEIGWRKSHEVTLQNATRVMLLSTAYEAALSLQGATGNHQFIKSGNTFVAENFALDHIDILIKQIEGIDYANTPFAAEINQRLGIAKEYVKNARAQLDNANK